MVEEADPVSTDPSVMVGLVILGSAD